MEVNFYEMYLEEMALIPVLEAEEEKKVLALAAAGDKEAKKRLVEGYLAKTAQMVKEYEDLLIERVLDDTHETDADAINPSDL